MFAWTSVKGSRVETKRSIETPKLRDGDKLCVRVKKTLFVRRNKAKRSMVRSRKRKWG